MFGLEYETYIPIKCGLSRHMISVHNYSFIESQQKNSIQPHFQVDFFMTPIIILRRIKPYKSVKVKLGKALVWWIMRIRILSENENFSISKFKCGVLKQQGFPFAPCYAYTTLRNENELEIEVLIYLRI